MKDKECYLKARKMHKKIKLNNLILKGLFKFVDGNKINKEYK